MSEDSYTIKEFIAHLMEDLNKKVDNVHVDVKETKEQAYKTNGRVSRLEWWRSAVVWAIGVLGIILMFLLPYMFKLIDKVNKLDFTITEITTNYK